MELILLDKSAWVRGGGRLTELGDLRLCAITRLEILHSARDGDEHARLADDLDTFRDLRLDAATWRSAETAQAELASVGRHRVPLPDLLIAACAQQHGAAVAHLDRRFDLLTEVLAFRSIRIDGAAP